MACFALGERMDGHSSFSFKATPCRLIHVSPPSHSQGFALVEGVVVTVLGVLILLVSVNRVNRFERQVWSPGR